MFYFGYLSTGVIVQCAPDPSLLSSGLSVLAVENTDVTAQVASTNLDLYSVVNGALSALPNFTLATSGSDSAGYTFTATLNNAPASPPTSATFSILGSTFAVPLTNNVATLTVNIHPSVSGSQLSVSVSAPGVVGTGASIGENEPPITIQAVSPSSGTATVGPSGTSAVQFLQQYYAVNSTTVEALLTNAMTGMSILYDTVFNVLLPFAQQATYTPVTLDANQANAVSALKTGILGTLPTTLENGDPSGGIEQMQFSAFVANFKSAAQNVTAFMEALQTFNL